jgi:delta-aminolevulinic acid dehydratase/porphobilinogen synthase
MNDWLKERKIAQMPGVPRTAVNTLASTLEKAVAGKIKSVYIGIQWEDDTYCGDWSNQPISSLAMHALMAHKMAAEVITPGGEIVST